MPVPRKQYTEHGIQIAQVFVPTAEDNLAIAKRKENIKLAKELEEKNKKADDLISKLEGKLKELDKEGH